MDRHLNYHKTVLRKTSTALDKTSTSARQYFIISFLKLQHVIAACSIYHLVQSGNSSVFILLAPTYVISGITPI